MFHNPMDIAVEIVPAEQTVFTGATAFADGRRGLVPPPCSGDRLRFLRGDCTWQEAPASTGVLCELPRGWFGLHVNNAGHLILTYQPPDEPPALSIGANGHLYYTFTE